MHVNITYERSFIAWITVITPLYSDRVIAGMVKKGYTVSAAAGNGEICLSRKDSPASLITLKVSSNDENISVVKIHTDLLDVLKEIKALQYSVIVSAMADCCWCNSNITFPEKAPAPKPPLPPTNKSNLN